MGLSDLQGHIQGIPDAVKVVDLLKLGIGKKRPFTLVVDGECCLDRLYGGYFPDWVCGGQWNKMEQFLSNFASVIHNSPLDLVVFLNGCLESDRLTTEWCKNQEVTYKHLQEIQKHVTVKRKPPPKLWWIPPAFLRSALRLACRSFHIKIMCSLEDHHKDLLRFAQNGNLDGIIADDAEYLVFDIPRYFSAQKLKLTFKGSLDTEEVKLDKVFQSLDLSKERFLIFAAIIGNHILSEEDLKSFYTSLGIQNLQSKASVIEKVALFVKTFTSLELEKVADMIVLQVKPNDEAAGLILRKKVLKCLNYYGALGQPKLRASSSKHNSAARSGKKVEKAKSEERVEGESTQNTSTISNISSTLPSDNENLENVTKLFVDQSESATDAEISPPDANLPNPIKSETCFETPVQEKNKENLPSSVDKLLYRVSYPIESIAVNRHKNGIMSPYICQILKNKEIRLPVIIEDIKNVNELPRAHEVFRPLRQRVYAILFNLHHINFMAKKKSENEPVIFVKESRFDPVTKTVKTVGVPAVQIGWAVPTVEKLWLGDGDEAKKKRIRAFLTCLKSEKQTMLDSNIVPQQLLIMCCVLRYIISENKVLRKTELDAFIAQALILELTEPNVAQDIEVTNLTMRGVHLSHLFMEGVEMALLVNDACGAPIPFMLFSPWYFFNGKILNFVLQQMALGKGLPEICGFKMNLVFKINQLRMAILEGVKPQFAPPSLNSFFLHNNLTPLMPEMMGNGRFPAGIPNPFDERNTVAGAGGFRVGRQLGGNSYYPNSYPSDYSGYQLPSFIARSNSGVLPDNLGAGQRRSHRGAQLEVAGTIVGSWGASTSYGSNPNHGFVYRNPIQSVSLSQADSNHVISLMGQMRISQGNKVPNSRSGPHSGNQWNQRKTKNQKRTYAKKNAGSASSTSADTSTHGSQDSELIAAATSSSNVKSKGVSFQDEPSIEKFTRAEDGSGDARILGGLGQTYLFGESSGSLQSGEGTESSQSSQPHHST